MADSWHWQIGIKRPFKALAKELRAAMQPLLTEEGVRWHKESLPKHFTEPGAEEYRFARRARKYSAKKWRVFYLLRAGNGKKVKFFFEPDVMSNMPRPAPRPGPLVVTGRTRAMARGQAQVRASSQKVRVTFPVPPYINWNGPGPDKAEELRRVSAQEAYQMKRRIERALPRRIMAARGE